MSFSIRILLIVPALVLASCGSSVKVEQLRDGVVSMGLSIAGDDVEQAPKESDVVIDSIRSSLVEGPVLMKAIKDTETGEMVATDVISASKVTARFRNVAERDGYVAISFDISVPSEMASSRWQLKIFPYMLIQNDSVSLDAVFLTGEQYRGRQLRGYERYNDFMESLLRDSLDFLRIGQLEVFLQRHFPQTYAMKTDSAFVSEPDAVNLFGVTQRDALEHYRKTMKWKHNERRKNLAPKKFRRYVKDPILSEGVRLDTVLSASDDAFVYRYTHTFRSRPGLKKVYISLDGQIYEDGEFLVELPFPQKLTFYISSLSSLTEESLKYKMIVRQRRVYDHTNAFIDFDHGSSVIDTALSDNASELRRVIQCIDDVVARDEYELDSLVILASCSPEGSFKLNTELSDSRSKAVKAYIQPYVPEQWKDSLRTSSLPENWDRLIRLVEHDTMLAPQVRRRIAVLAHKMEGGPDVVEKVLSEMPEYSYLREKIYPKLRNVRFDFHLHRVGMVQDTVVTTEPDTVYMSGIAALKALDYRKAVTVLRPYDDYNAALAFVCADYNHSALDVLDRLDASDPAVCYLKAMVLARLEQYEEALKYFELALLYDPSLIHRANLDPEMYEIVKLKQKE